MALAAREERFAVGYERAAWGTAPAEGAVTGRRSPGHTEGYSERHDTRNLTRRRSTLKVRLRMIARTWARIRTPLLGMFAAILGGCMAVLVLMGYIELTRLSAETVTLKNQLEVLRSENVVLSAKYDRMFDLASVKEAAEAAGMVKPSVSQVSYLDLSEGDCVIVHPHEESGPVSRLMAYTRNQIGLVKEFFS